MNAPEGFAGQLLSQAGMLGSNAATGNGTAQDQQQQSAGQADANSNQQGTGQVPPNTSGKDASYWYAEATKSFAARDEERTKRKELEAKVLELERQTADRLAAGGDLQESLKAYKAQNETLSVKAQRTDDLEAAIGVIINDLRSTLPKEVVDSLPKEMSPLSEVTLLQTFNKQLGTLTIKPTVNTSAPLGATGIGNSNPLELEDRESRANAFRAMDKKTLSELFLAGIKRGR